MPKTESAYHELEGFEGIYRVNAEGQVQSRWKKNQPGKEPVYEIGDVFGAYFMLNDWKVSSCADELYSKICRISTAVHDYHENKCLFYAHINRLLKNLKREDI